MSGPMSSLKKTSKSPFPGNSGNRHVPFRHTQQSTDVDSLLDDVTAEMASTKLNKNSTKPLKKSHSSAAPSDNELMTVMMSRLSQLEQQLLHATQENLEKERRIKVLEEKCKLLSKAREAGDSNPSKVNELEKKCLKQQRQIHDMEQFLEDYGMMWVGEDSNSEAEEDEDYDDVTTTTNKFWNPASSTSEKFQVDFDRVISNINDLNVIAGEGVAKVQHTVGGARLKMPDPIQLTLYMNGIVMFSGPFRSYEEQETQQCMKDLMEGYFPSELQSRYPDGIPFVLTDKRHTYFKDKWDDNAFMGSGQTLGGETKPSRLVPSNLDKVKTNNKPTQCQATDVTSTLPGDKVPMEQFMNKIPKNVIKGGKVIRVRDSLSDHIQGQSKSSVTVVDTKAMEEMKERLEEPPKERPSSAKEVATLRIKSEKGDKTFLLKMKFNETVGDIRKYLTKKRPHASASYELISTFPKMVYKDNKKTLKEAGLTPNATLHIKLTKKY